MSALDSTSTLAEIKAAYADNASYAEDGSTTKAAVFITACRLLLIKLPVRARQSNRFEVELDVAQIAQQLDDAKRWLATHRATPAGGVRHVTFQDFRD